MNRFDRTHHLLFSRRMGRTQSLRGGRLARRRLTQPEFLERRVVLAAVVAGPSIVELRAAMPAHDPLLPDFHVAGAAASARNTPAAVDSLALGMTPSAQATAEHGTQWGTDRPFARLSGTTVDDLFAGNERAISAFASSSIPLALNEGTVERSLTMDSAVAPQAAASGFASIEAKAAAVQGSGTAQHSVQRLDRRVMIIQGATSTGQNRLEFSLWGLPSNDLPLVLDVKGNVQGGIDVPVKDSLGHSSYGSEKSGLDWGEGSGLSWIPGTDDVPGLGEGRPPAGSRGEGRAAAKTPSSIGPAPAALTTPPLIAHPSTPPPITSLSGHQNPLGGLDPVSPGIKAGVGTLGGAPGTAIRGLAPTLGAGELPLGDTVGDESPRHSPADAASSPPTTATRRWLGTVDIAERVWMPATASPPHALATMNSPRGRPSEVAETTGGDSGGEQHADQALRVVSASSVTQARHRNFESATKSPLMVEGQAIRMSLLPVALVKPTDRADSGVSLMILPSLSAADASGGTLVSFRGLVDASTYAALREFESPVALAKTAPDTSRAAGMSWRTRLWAWCEDTTLALGQCLPWDALVVLGGFCASNALHRQLDRED